jgi:hypothetical protein
MHVRVVVLLLLPPQYCRLQCSKSLTLHVPGHCSMQHSAADISICEQREYAACIMSALLI